MIHTTKHKYKGKELVLSNPENYTTQVYCQTMDVEVLCVDIVMSAERKLSCYSATRRRCV